MPIARPRRSTAPRERPVPFRVQAPLSLASLLAPLNSTMIAVALPAVRSEFHVGVGALTWLVSSYLIAVAISQPVGGRLGDAIGHLRVVMAGLVALLVFSLAAAFAWSFLALVVFRALQGIGAAFVLPNALAFLRKQVPPNQLGAALGANNAAVSAGAALGPVVGGILLTAADWRWLFLANVPLSAIALWLVVRLPADAGLGRKALVIDLPSLLSVGGAFSGLTLLGTAARLHNPLLVAAGAGLLPLSLAGLVTRYRLRGTAIVDLRLFTRRNYVAAAAGVSLANLVMYSTLVAMPVYLGDLRHASDAAVAVLLFAMSVAMVGVAPLAGRFSDRAGNRPPLVAGALVLLVSSAMFALVLDEPPLFMLIGPLLLVGLGLGVSGAPQQSAALQAWPPSMAGSAAGTFSMMRYVGSITGTAIIAALLGAHPDEPAFRLLFTVLALFAVANLAAALSVAKSTPATLATSLATQPASSET